jgi:hypothetical protein
MPSATSMPRRSHVVANYVTLQLRDVCYRLCGYCVVDGCFFVDKYQTKAPLSAQAPQQSASSDVSCGHCRWSVMREDCFASWRTNAELARAGKIRPELGRPTWRCLRLTSLVVQRHLFLCRKACLRANVTAGLVRVVLTITNADLHRVRWNGTDHVTRPQWKPVIICHTSIYCLTASVVGTICFDDTSFTLSKTRPKKLICVR